MTPGAALLAAGFLLTSQTAAPPPPDRVTGIVLDAQTSAPIVDALVTLVEPARSTRTAADGRFTFDRVAPGAYSLTVSTIGYIFVRRRVEIGANGALDLTIPLAEGTGTYHENVTVTATQQPSEPASTTTELSSAALQELRGVVADDPVRAVQALPGVATGNDFQAEFSVRGSAFRHVGIVMDGIATPLLFHGVRGTEDKGSVAMINTDVLDSASLSVGAHPQRHGDWLGATLDFNVREGSRDRTAARVAISGTNTSVVVEGPVGRAKRGSWLATVRKSYVEWLVRKILPNVDSTIGFADSQSKFSYDLTKRQQISFLTILGEAIYTKPSANTPNDIKRASSSSALGSLSWRYAGDRFIATQRLAFVTNWFKDVGSVTQEQARGHTNAIVWRGDLSRPIGSAWTFESGAKVEHQAMAQTLRSFFLQAGLVKLRVQQPFGETRVASSVWTNMTRRGPSGAITAGVRASFDTRTQSTVAAPWLTLERTIGRVQFSGSAGYVNQFPDLESVGEAASPLLPEHASMFDLGVGVQLTKAIRWRVTGYTRRESNILREEGEDRLQGGQRIAAGTFPTFASTLDGTSRGVDIVIERHAASGPTGWLGYTWSHTREHDRVTGETFDGDFDQRHTLNVFVEQRLSYRMRATAKFRYGSNFPIVGYFSGTPEALFLGETRNAVRLPRYARLDLDLSRTFTFERRRLTLFIEILNLLNRKNYGPFQGTVRNSTFSATGFTTQLIPILPSAGMLLEF